MSRQGDLFEEIVTACLESHMVLDSCQQPVSLPDVGTLEELLPSEGKSRCQLHIPAMCGRHRPVPLLEMAVP